MLFESRAEYVMRINCFEWIIKGLGDGERALTPICKNIAYANRYKFRLFLHCRALIIFAIFN